MSKKQFDTLIIDDAHIIVSGQMIDMFKGKQLIVSGDYQSNKVVNQNLISILTNSQTITFRKRLVLGPRK